MSWTDTIDRAYSATRATVDDRGCQHPMDYSLQPERCGDPETEKCDQCGAVVCAQHTVEFEGSVLCFSCVKREMDAEC